MKGHALPLREIDNKFTELKMALQFADVEEASSVPSSPVSFVKSTTSSSPGLMPASSPTSQATANSTPSPIEDVISLNNEAGMAENPKSLLDSNLKPTRVLAIEKQRNLHTSLSGPLGKEQKDTLKGKGGM